MEDYFKAQLRGIDPGELTCRHDLEFFTTFSEETGAIKEGSCKEAFFGPQLHPYGSTNRSRDRVMRIKITPKGIILIDGSLHKLAQRGTNHGHFSHDERIQATDDLTTMLRCSAGQMALFKLEWGVNITPPRPTGEMIKSMICYGPGKQFSRMPGSSQNSPGLMIHCSDYIIKIYDKGQQYGLKKEVMRVEIHFSRRRKLHKCDAYNMHDLNDTRVRNLITTECLRILDRLFILEPDLEQKVQTNEDRIFLARAATASYWADIAHPETRRRDKARYSGMVNHYLGHSIVQEFRQQVQAAFMESCIPGGSISV